MHQPRPYGRFVRGDDLSGEDAAEVARLTKLLTNYKQVSDLESLRWGRRLPSGRWAVAQDMGGILKVLVREAPQYEVEEEGFETLYVPMLFSGVITHARLLGDEGVGIRLSESTRRRIDRSVRDEDWQTPEQVSLQRFRIGINGAVVGEFEPPDGVGFYTQYVAQRPTWYSGTMAELMQIVGGYGRQDLRALPDHPVERARVRIPERYRRRIETQVADLSQPWCKGVPPSNGQYQFDYKFFRTDAVGFDAEGKPWLLRVIARGVFAMPLPMVPATTAAAFREWIEELADDEMLAVLDRFGGMPSGEPMPQDEDDFEAWRRAGAIIKVCEVANFYEHLAYTEACGWAFNRRGSEAYNTCYGYDGAGIAQGYLYKMSLSLAPVQPPTGREPPDDAAQAAALAVYLASLAQRLREAGLPAARRAAIQFKLGRATTQQLLARAGGTVGVGEVAFWDNFEAAPMAAHHGSVSRVGAGPLYHPFQFFDQPQIKFPDVRDHTVLSFDFTPLQEVTVQPRCDTVMYAYYAQDQLRVVKYFYDPREFRRTIEGNFEDCMTVGSWEQTEFNSPTGLQGNFYTTDFDEREEMTGETVLTRIVGTDLGYDSHPKFGFVTPISIAGSIWRSRYYTHDSRRETRTGNAKLVAVCVPFLSRCAILHADQRLHTGGSDTEARVLNAMDDPHSYGMWTYHPIAHWTAPELEKMSAKPYPEWGTPVWVEVHRYNPTLCNDFADEGDWVGGLPQDFSWLVNGPYSPAGTPPKVQEFGRSTAVPSSVQGKTQIQFGAAGDPVNRSPSARYFISSPDRDGTKWYRDATGVRFGDSVYYSSDEPDPEDPKRRKHWGFTRLADHESAHHFIGVIHE